LGHGKGYYDRLLSGIDAPKIGLAYTMQMVAEVPHTSYDVPMTMVVTEK
jgi:5-formyltetrahydrofolate cyclo-ligase